MTVRTARPTWICTELRFMDSNRCTTIFPESMIYFSMRNLVRMTLQPPRLSVVPRLRIVSRRGCSAAEVSTPNLLCGILGISWFSGTASMSRYVSAQF
jgi:hypothetical protein